MIQWLRRILGIGPSLRDRLLDQLDLQARQMTLDRTMWREVINDMNERGVEIHKHTTDLVKSLAESVREQGASFNRYLDLITPKGDPQVRVMTDALEAKLEADYYKEHNELRDVIKAGQFIDSPLADSLSYQDSLFDGIKSLTREIT